MKTSNEERYKKSFDNLHLSGDFSSRLNESLEKEREDKKVVKLFSAGKIAAAIAICTLACGTACYAADVGGIRTSFNIWINGTNHEIEVQDDGNGGYSYTDENGHEYGFGGVSYGPGGEEVPMSAEELVELMNNDGTLEFTEDDKVIFHYRNLSEDVTDQIKDGKLYIHLEDPTNPYTYFNFSEIVPNGSYSLTTDDSKEGSADYVEVDATNLATGEPAPERGDDEVYGTYILSD
ncbi:MAG: hypothetical protein J6X94_04140 [Lachnospiraceae bacterium]|nr:hypothetical protein [Lachnospiraceae bacterium]